MSDTNNFQYTYWKLGDVCVLLHALLLVGLGEGADPLAKLCATWPLPLARDVALGAYFLQGAVLRAWSGWGLTGSGHGRVVPWWEVLLVYAALLVGSVVLQLLVQDPLGALLFRAAGREPRATFGREAKPPPAAQAAADMKALP